VYQEYAAHLDESQILSGAGVIYQWQMSKTVSTQRELTGRNASYRVHVTLASKGVDLVEL
jgi:hypothetical protein